MSKQDDQFRSENIDEQIEHFSQEQESHAPLSSDKARLISNLRAVHQEDAEIIQQVWERLAIHRAQKRQAGAGQNVAYFPLPDHVRQEHQKGPQVMEPIVTKKQARKKFFRTLELLAAVIIVGLLIGSMLVVFHFRQPAQTHLANPGTSLTPTPSPTQVVDTSGLYLSTKTGIDKISLQTGKVLWHIPLDWASQPFVIGNIVFFSHEVSNDAYLEAVNATTGKQIWRKNYGSSSFLLQESGVLYDSTCFEGPNQESTGCYIDAIRPADGTLLWSFPTPQGTAWMTIQPSGLYGVSYTDVFALNLTNGKPIWQKTLPYPDQAINQTPLVLNQTLYAASCNSTKGTQVYTGCYFLAFNITNGTILWHTTAPASMLGQTLVTDPTGSNGILYYANLTHVYAVSTSTGSTLWTYTACTGSCAITHMSATPDILYIQVDSTTAPLLALNLAHRSVIWSQNAVYGTWLQSQNLIYVVVNQLQVKVLDASNGTKTKSYTDGTETLTGLVLVTPDA